MRLPVQVLQSQFSCKCANVDAPGRVGKCVVGYRVEMNHSQTHVHTPLPAPPPNTRTIPFTLPPKHTYARPHLYTHVRNTPNKHARRSQIAQLGMFDSRTLVTRSERSRELAFCLYLRSRHCLQMDGLAQRGTGVKQAGARVKSERRGLVFEDPRAGVARCFLILFACHMSRPISVFLTASARAPSQRYDGGSGAQTKVR